MLETYVLKTNCPVCGAKSKSTWKYCSSCGSFVGNDGPRVKVSRAFNLGINDEVTEPDFDIQIDELKELETEEVVETVVVEEIETPSPKVNPIRIKSVDLGSYVNKVSEAVKTKAPSESQPSLSSLLTKMSDGLFVTLDDADTLSNQNITPLLIIIDDEEVRSLKYIPHNVDNGIYFPKIFSNDQAGYFFNPESIKESYKNGELIKGADNVYLRNGDTIKVGSNLYLYTILDQEEVNWNREYLSQEVLDTYSLNEYFYLTDKGLMVKANDYGGVYLNNNQVVMDSLVGNYAMVSIDARHFAHIDNYLIFQDELTNLQKTSNSIRANRISDNEALTVNIKENRVGNKVLLKDIHFEVKPGEMVLILGGSGAGKTTLIKSIMGELKADASIQIGPYDIYEDFELVKRMIADVPQFNLSRPKDTVFNTLKDAGEMKLPHEFIKDKRLFYEYLDEILIKLNLYKSKDTLVSSLSGGEKKRLSIATEYVADPILFILDEPDSGLDGMASRDIIENLRTIADDNKVVMIISHTPDRTPEHFDKVLVLAKSEELNCGQLAFFGSVEETKEFFDIDLLEMVIREINEKPDHYIAKYQEYLMAKGQEEA